MMNRSILSRTAFAAAVALALGFGAREAVASSEVQAARPFCTNNVHCQSICDGQYGPGNTVGFCSAGHTCSCYFY